MRDSDILLVGASKGLSHMFLFGFHLFDISPVGGGGPYGNALYFLLILRQALSFIRNLHTHLELRTLPQLTPVASTN